MINNRTSGETVKSVGTILSELKADGKIENYGDIDGNVAVTEIQFDVNSVILGIGDNSGTLTATFLPENTTGGYYIEVKGRKYPVSKVNGKIEIGKIEVTTEVSSTREIVEVETSDSAVATVKKSGTDGIIITGVAGGTSTITVKYSENIKTTLEVAVGNFATVIVQSNDMDKGTVSLSPSSINNKYAEGSAISLTATENSGYYFDGWYNGTTKLSESSSYNYTVRSSDITIEARFLKYGRTVNLGTVTANNVTMASGWKYFLEDSDNIYLMYGDYLENVQIPSGTNITKGGYTVRSSSNRYDLVDYLNGATETYINTWKEINDGIKEAVKTRLMENNVSEENANTIIENIVTKGAATPEQWISSYNENYGTKLGTQNFTSSGQIYYNSNSDGSINTDSTTTIRYTGYLYTRDITANQIQWEENIPADYMNKQAGYPGIGKSNMYYPRTQNGYPEIYGYWLARSGSKLLIFCVCNFCI